jgi:hypothetical protein
MRQRLQGREHRLGAVLRQQRVDAKKPIGIGETSQKHGFLLIVLGLQEIDQPFGVRQCRVVDRFSIAAELPSRF